MAEQQYMAIARKWRPQRFDEVVGQAHITRTLTNALTSGRIHHAFLFIGSRGIGKTTTARILAKALNCGRSAAPTGTPCCECENCSAIAAGNHIDVIEIDGASNNTVEDVRAIRENVCMAPTQSRYKVYIIDEVHQLSSSAFNALLKTLEEPPGHAVFILATTEAHKIPATIISRCQRYDFRRVAIKDIVALLKRILTQEDVVVTDGALHAIARFAEGGIRDAESILDELISYCDDKIDVEDVFDLLGLVDWQAFHNLCDALLDGNVARELEIVEEVTAAGKDLSQFVEDLLRYFRNLLVCRTAGADENLLRLPEAEIEALKTRAGRFSVTKLIKIVEQFADLVDAFDSQVAQRTTLEALLIRLSRVDADVSLESVMEKLMLLGAGGVCSGAASGGARAEPPPNPPEAGPIHAAPAAPAEHRRLHLETAFLDEQWRTLMLKAGECNLNMGVWLGRARPERVDDAGVLELVFEPGAAKALAFFQEPVNKEALERFLHEYTDNVRTVHWRQANDGDKMGDASARMTEQQRQGAQKTGKKPFDAFLEHEGIAAVVDEFKGAIVDVRK